VNQKIFLKVSRVIFVLILIGIVPMVFWQAKALKVITVNDKEEDGEVFSGVADESEILVGAAVAGVNSVPSIIEQVGTDDAWPELIRRYLEKYKSPLLPYSELIYQVSKTYGFKPYWILAIGQQESNLCKKIPENSHNCWGYGIHSKGTLRFDNYETAITSFAGYLKEQYFDKGRNTPELIMQKYCPHSDGSWAAAVTHLIREIEGGNF
jgi:hypothetical protein